MLICLVCSALIVVHGRMMLKRSFALAAWFIQNAGVVITIHLRSFARVAWLIQSAGVVITIHRRNSARVAYYIHVEALVTIP